MASPSSSSSTHASIDRGDDAAPSISDARLIINSKIDASILPSEDDEKTKKAPTQPNMTYVDFPKRATFDLVGVTNATKLLEWKSCGLYHGHTNPIACPCSMLMTCVHEKAVQSNGALTFSMECKRRLYIAHVPDSSYAPGTQIVFAAPQKTQIGLHDQFKFSFVLPYTHPDDHYMVIHASVEEAKPRDYRTFRTCLHFEDGERFRMNEVQHNVLSAIDLDCSEDATDFEFSRCPDGYDDTIPESHENRFGCRKAPGNRQLWQKLLELYSGGRPAFTFGELVQVFATEIKIVRALWPVLRHCVYDVLSCDNARAALKNEGIGKIMEDSSSLTLESFELRCKALCE